MIDAGNKEPSDFTTSCDGAQFPAKEKTGKQGEREGKFFIARSGTKRIPETFFSDRDHLPSFSPVCMPGREMTREAALTVSSFSSYARGARYA